MHRMPPPLSSRHRRPAQRGVALFIVIVFVMLSMLLALWASRTSLFNELVVGNDADYQRATESAQAMLQDAQEDIRLGTNEAPGSALCVGGGELCRLDIADQFPLAREEIPVGSRLAPLAAETTGCRSALCTKRDGKIDFWNNSDTGAGPTLEQMLAVGARYGQYTGAKYGDTSNPANPILADRDDGKGAFYWIEILPYDESSKTKNLIQGDAANLLPLYIDPMVVYRITALAFGRKPGTTVVIQQTYAPQKLQN
ncbi:MAG: pilus assembly PilX family protein [Giesbergeria sp.]